MSNYHNRIKVADLETNQPNKILITNSDGELEFGNINLATSDTYNALDYTIAGKSLDARQGNVLQNNKVDKVIGKSLISDTEITRLGTLSNYTHPANHPASIITQDTNNRFVTDAEKATWNAKQANITAGTTAQYFRGDKTWQTLDKTAAGLANVDNTADAAKNVLSATKLTTPRTINGVAFDGSANVTINAVDATPRIASSEKGAANGVATLDASGIILTSQLPSYVDDVLEYTNLAGFPATGETGKIYVAKDTNKTYRWSGTAYVYITSGAVDSVAGKTGVVTLAKADVGLASVDNTADTAKNVLSATKLTTPRTINGTSFDGTANITITDSTKENSIAAGTTAQYFRGDKTWQTLDKTAAGLANVDNTADAAKNVLSATKLTTPRTINGVAFDGSANVTINAVDATPRIASSEKGAANGVATLDASGIILTSQLPSYVDDVLEYTNLAGFPATGETGKIYVAKDTNKTYRWSGTAYVYITSGAVDSVAGKTGIVTLAKADVGLASVDNTADTAKNVLSATKLTTPRTINGTSFDGTANITITDSTKENSIAAGTTAQYFRGDKTWQTLDKTAAGLANVDNTADAAKNVLSATKLATARTINGTSFDGTANITITDATKENSIAAGTTSQYFRGDKTWQTLDKTAAGLANVDNTADAAKNVLSATKLTTPRTINGTSFDGTANITITDSTKENSIAAGTTAQYFRGDKTWQTLDKTAAGLANVDNTADAAKNVLSATKLTTSRTINGVSFDGTANVTINAVDATPRIASSEKGAANGVATLDASGIILTSQLPSYVDDVLEYTNLAGFPATGETGKIYVAKDTNKTYRWSGTAYVYITSGAVDSVAGKTGVVTLVKADVGLASVDNTADTAKNVLSATKLTTPRTINGVAFDGTANITITDSTKENSIAAGTTAQYFRGDKTWQTLDKTAAGLANVDNTADAAKNVLSATKLATARTINGTAFDGTANITITDATKQPIGSTFFIGTTSVANNRASASQALTGISIDGNAGSSTILQTARTINGVSFNGSANITINAVDATARIASSEKGAANGVATLDASGIILTSQLPSYVDDVLEFTNLAGFPTTGETGKIYVAKDTNKTYRWSGTAYVYITSGAVDSVAGKTGVVTLAKADVGLTNVDNTADTAKNVLSATKLTTPRTINGTSFDGSANITITDSTKENTINAGTTAQYFRGDKTWQTLDKTAAGLASVDNTADAAKNVLSATKLTTARTINGVSFDGTANITIADTSKLPIAGGTMQGDIIFPGTDRSEGVFGTYDSTKTQSIWSMGTAYRNAVDGSTFGTLYGFGYKHTNNTTGGTMAGGHQAVWCQAGSPKVALGDGIWTSGIITGTSFIGAATGLTGNAASLSIGGNAATATSANTATNSSQIGGISSNRVMMKRRLKINTSDSTSLNSSISQPEMGFTYGGSGEPVGPFISFGGLNSDIDYSCQLVGSYSGGNDFKIRTRNDDAAAWNPWRTLITDGNYNSYSPTLTGAGASGTWGINITGSAGGSAKYVDLLPNRTDVAAYPILWGVNQATNPVTGNASTYAFSCDAVKIQSSTGTVIANNFSGSGSGLTGTASSLSIGGSASSASRISFVDGPRTLSDRLPNSFARTVNFDFVNAGTVGGSGNYGGVMTFAPWDGLSTSTGDSSYQLAFRNESGVNGSGLPGLRLRKGIDTAWGGWYDVLHSGNYASFSAFSGDITGASLTVTGDVTAFSDARVKENIRPITNALERIQASRGVVYDRIDTQQKDNIGFIAQELEENFPELVLTREDGTKAVKYQNAVAVLFEAIKEQQSQIEELKGLVTKLLNS